MKPDTPFLTIVIPVFNGAPYLRDAIESVMAQSDPPAELYVLDNASTDETPTVLAEALAASPPVPIRVDRNPETIPGPANWARAATGVRTPFFSVLPADDTIEPAFAASVRRALIARPDAEFLFCCAFHAMNAAGEVTKLRDFRDPRWTGAADRQAFLDRLCKGMPFSPAGVVLAKEAYDRVGGYDAGFAGTFDYDFFLRICGQARGLYGLEEPLARCRYHDRSWTSGQHLDGPPDLERLLSKLGGYDFLSESQKRSVVEGACDVVRQTVSRRLRTPEIGDVAILKARKNAEARLRRWQTQFPEISQFVRIAPTPGNPMLLWHASRWRLLIPLIRDLLCRYR
ncbi:MAG: glycosyltransferase [Sumerlaeia bacterium]